MQIEFFKKIEIATSAERLNAYRQDGADELTTLARYLWNTAICESLYSPLQMVEIALRNSMHLALTAKFGSDDWYDCPRIMLTKFGQKEVDNAKDRLIQEKNLVVPGRIIAELQFGFWTSLLAFHYEKDAKIWPGLAKRAFPKAPREANMRKFLHLRFTKIRKLRNRVFHHERIIHWKDLVERHGEIIQAIGWINDGMEDLSLRLDRFLETHKAGIDPWKDKIRNHWSKDEQPDTPAENQN